MKNRFTVIFTFALSIKIIFFLQFFLFYCYFGGNSHRKLLSVTDIQFRKTP